MAEGLYFIKIAVTDTLAKTTYSTYTGAAFAVAVDTGAPSFSSVTPANGGYYSTAKTIAVTGKVTDASGVVSLQLTSANQGSSSKYSGATFLTLANGSASILDTVTPPSSDGSYEVVYTATDAYGQSSTYAISYLVDTTPPSFYITTSKKDDASYLIGTEISTKSTSQQVTLVVSDTCTSSGTLYSSTVTSGISSVAWSIDDGKSTGNSGVLNYSSSYTGGLEIINSNFSVYKGTLLLTDGVKNTATFKITDNAGNMTTVSTNPVYTVDSTAPSISITGYDSTPYNGSKIVSFTVTATDNKKLDTSSDSYKITASNDSKTATLGTDYTVATSGTDTDTTAVRTVKILSDGSFNGNWTFTANVKDAAGWPATQQSNTLLVDSIAPEITVTNLADNAGLYGDAGSYKAYLDTSTGNYSLRGKWKDVTSSGIAGSGTNKLSYSFDGTNYSDFSDTANVTTEKNFTVDLPVTEGKKKDIYLKATDIAGNTSAVKHFTGIAIDYSAPVVSFEDNITQYTAKDGTLTFTATSTDSYAISASDVTVTATKDGAEVPLDASFTASSAQTGSSTKSVTTTINVAAGTTGTYDGSWVFTVSATDGSGRTVTKSTNSTILIDTRSATYIDNLSTTPTATKSTSLPVTLIVSDTCTSDGSSTYTGSGISSVNWSVDDTNSTGQNGTLNYSAQYTGGSGSNATTINNNFAVYKGTVLLTDGYTNTITFSITDKAGNKTTVAKQPVYTVDTVIPTITIGDYKKSTSSKEDITFTATLEDNSKLDLSASSIVIKGANDSGNATLGTDYTVATSGTDIATKAVRTITILKAGSHDGNWTFTINVKDAAGWSAEQKTISVQVDTTAPTVVTAASVNNVTAISDIYYIKKANGCTFKGTVKDALSGLKNVYVKVLKSSESAPTFTASEWTAADINPTTGAWSYVLDTSSTAYSDNTNYKLYAVAVDALNNASAIELAGTIAEVFADASVPVFTFAETPASSTSSGSATTTMTYEATYYRSSAAAISGTVTDSSFSGCTYTLTTNPNNDAGSVSKTVPTTSGGTWSVTPVALKTGNYVYTFTATDKAGYSSKAVITVVVDKTAPTFTITNSEVSTASKLQSNSTITESNAYYTTSGSNSYYTVNGTWTDDDNGTAGTGTYKLYYTKDSTATTDSLTGWTDAGATTSATGSTKWSVDITIEEGISKYLAFFAVDNAGNKSVVKSFTGLAYDFSAPVAAFTSISGTSYKYTGEAQTITVVGTVTDSYKIASATPTAKLGGNTVSSGSSGLVISQQTSADNKKITVTYKVTIDKSSGAEDGIWVFSLEGADASGRNATLVSSSSITVDTIAPMLTVSNAANDSANLLSTGTKLITETNSNYKVSGGSSYYVLTGKWSDATTGTSTLEYSTDGGSNWNSITGVAQTTSETSWNVDVPVAQATSTGSIQVRATDAAGNVTTPTADSTKFTGLTFDFAVPTVSLTNGTSEVVTNTAPFALTGTLKDSLALGSTNHGLTITASKNGASDSSLLVNSWTETALNKD
ncbi:MAG: Ig-like domain-containing protein, partial [Treponema sp.]